MRSISRIAPGLVAFIDAMSDEAVKQDGAPLPQYNVPIMSQPLSSEIRFSTLVVRYGAFHTLARLRSDEISFAAFDLEIVAARTGTIRFPLAVAAGVPALDFG